MPSLKVKTTDLASRRASLGYAILAMLLVLGTEQIIEHFAHRSVLEREKTSVLENLSTISARLEGVINSNLLLVHGLTAVISAQPDLDQVGFSRIANGLVDERHALRNIAAAPNMVISLIYPLESNRDAIGLNYLTHPTQSAAARRVMETGKSVVAGPLPLVQGGIGIIAREPVYVPALNKGEQSRFWGLVSAVIDVDKLYRLAGLGNLNLKLRLALRGTDGTGASGPVFYGNTQVFESDPVTRLVSLPGGTWQLAAIPAQGWGQANDLVWMIRLLAGMAGLTAAILAYRLASGTRALIASNARLQTLLDTIPDLIWVKDPEGKYLACNSRFELYFGAREIDILGKTDYDFVPEDIADCSREKDKAAIAAGGACVNEEWVSFASDGHRELLETIKTPVFDNKDNLLGVLGIARDITERKLTEQALRKSEDSYRTLLEMAPFPAVISRVRDGTLLYGNQRAEIQYGINREEGIGQPADSFYEDTEERDRFVASLEKQGYVNDLEVRMRSMDGRRFWALISASIVDFDNEPAIFAAINDITRRKQVEAALEEQEAFFRLIAESMDDMVAVLDTEGRRLYNSPSYRALFGSPEALRGTDSFAEIHPDDRDRIYAIFQDTVQTGVGHRINFRFVLADGEIRDIESQGGVIRGADGRVERVVVVSRDITERKRLEDEVRQLNSELEERVRQRTTELATANKELETFTYSVSHDLKAPLRGIDGYSRLLLEDHRAQLDEEGRLFLNNVRNGVDQMNQLIDDLLSYSRMERRSMHGVEVNLQHQVGTILAERMDELAEKGVLVKQDISVASAHADPDGLKIVLRNLLDNAIKFSRDRHPATIEIASAANENSTILSVKDNGIGFDMQFEDRIFEIFQRLQRAEDFPGTGVGLAIVRKVMQRMDGRIWVKSEPGVGTTFFLELPK